MAAKAKVVIIFNVNVSDSMLYTYTVLSVIYISKSWKKIKYLLNTNEKRNERNGVNGFLSTSHVRILKKFEPCIELGYFSKSCV